MSTGTDYHNDVDDREAPERHGPRCRHCGGDLWITTDGEGRLVDECSNCRLYARVRIWRNVPLLPGKGATALRGPRKRDDDAD